MLSGDLFDLVDNIARAVRANVQGASGRAFGGMQLILCGDFLQLPPVSKSGPVPYCFDSAAWSSAGLDKGMCILQEVHRQSSDPLFVTMLNELRRGVCSGTTLAALSKCHVKKKKIIEDGILPTRLYCTNFNGKLFPPRMTISSIL
jgi:ATP-dependent DNA helicase PIF1